MLPTRKGLRIFQAVVRDETGMIEVSGPGSRSSTAPSPRATCCSSAGRCRFFHGRQLQPREFVNLGDDDPGSAQGRVLAVYPATEGLPVRQIRAIIEQHLDALLPLVQEYLPAGGPARRGRPAAR